MADFTTHIDLHGATDTDYLALDKEMFAANFATIMRSPFGQDYKLPRGVYFSQAFDMAPADVRNLAMAAARRVGKRYDIVTTGGDIAYFLHPIDAPQPPVPAAG